MLARQSVKSRIARKTSFVLAGIVVFATTYSLILPALTLDQSMTDMPGLHIGQKPVVVEVLNSTQESRQSDRGDGLLSGRLSTVVPSANGTETDVPESDHADTSVDIASDHVPAAPGAVDETASGTEQNRNGSVAASEVEPVLDRDRYHKEILWVDRGADQTAIDQAIEDAFGDQVKPEPAVKMTESLAENIQPENTAGITASDENSEGKNPEEAVSGGNENPEDTSGISGLENESSDTVNDQDTGITEGSSDAVSPEEKSEDASPNNDALENDLVDDNPVIASTADEESQDSVELAPDITQPAESSTENLIETDPSVAENTESNTDQTVEEAVKPETWLQNTANTALNQNMTTLTFDFQ